MDARRKSLIFATLVGAALIAPRLARFYYPEAFFEDAPYLNVIACLSRGLKPHADFIHAHFVFPEIGLALFYLIFSATYRVTEAATALAVTATAILIYFLGKDLHSRRVGAVAAILYAAHPVFFLYHVFEKEIYEALFAAALALVIWRPPREGWRLALRASFLCFLGFLSKIDFASVAAFICLYLLAVERKGKEAFLLGGMFLGLVIAVSALLTKLYGAEFLRQVYLFHFFKGYESSWAAKFFKWVLSGGYLFFMGIAGLPFLGRVERNKGLYLIFWMAGPILFFLFITDTFWVHNIITLLPPLSLLGALFIEECVRWLSYLYLRSRKRPDGADLSRKQKVLVPIFLVVLVASTCLYFAFVWKQHFGFGGASRAELDKMAAVVRRHSHRGNMIIAPEIVAAQSNRTDIVNNREVYPVYVWAMKRVRERGFFEARREALGVHFRKLYEDTRANWIDMAWKEIESGRVAVVVGNRRPDVEVFVQYQAFSPDPDRMIEAGYRIVYSNEAFLIWTNRREYPAGD